jgi:hypothetical protein
MEENKPLLKAEKAIVAWMFRTYGCAVWWAMLENKRGRLAGSVRETV